MRLNELLTCVGLDNVQFTNYRRRDQLPFSQNDEFSMPPGEVVIKKWVNYNLSDALRLQIMVDLSEYKSPEKTREPEISKRYDGLPPLAASTIAQNSESNAYAKYGGLSGILKQPNDIWHVAIANASLHNGQLCYGMDHFSGTLVECAQEVEKRKEGQVRAILFNLSQVLNRVLDAGKTGAVSEVIDFLDAQNA